MRTQAAASSLASHVWGRRLSKPHAPSSSSHRYIILPEEVNRLSYERDEIGLSFCNVGWQCIPLGKIVRWKMNDFSSVVSAGSGWYLCLWLRRSCHVGLRNFNVSTGTATCPHNYSQNPASGPAYPQPHTAHSRENNGQQGVGWSPAPLLRQASGGTQADGMFCLWWLTLYSNASRRSLLRSLRSFQPS